MVFVGNRAGSLSQPVSMLNFVARAIAQRQGGLLVVAMTVVYMVADKVIVPNSLREDLPRLNT